MSKREKEFSNEFVAIYNDMLEKIGCAERSVANLNGLWHYCSQCWLVNSNKKTVIFQQRSIKKSVANGLFDVSASGHVELGSDTIKTAIRETYEELGIIIDPLDLIPAGRRIDLFQRGSILSRIFADVFFVLGNYALDKCTIDDREISGIVEIPIEEGVNLFSGKTDKINCKGFQFNDKLILTPHIFRIKKEMFIKRYDSYYLKVFIAAERLIKGFKYIAI